MQKAGATQVRAISPSTGEALKLLQAIKRCTEMCLSDNNAKLQAFILAEVIPIAHKHGLLQMAMQIDKKKSREENLHDFVVKMTSVLNDKGFRADVAAMLTKYSVMMKDMVTDKTLVCLKDNGCTTGLTQDIWEAEVALLKFILDPSISKALRACMQAALKNVELLVKAKK